MVAKIHKILYISGVRTWAKDVAADFSSQGLRQLVVGYKGIARFFHPACRFENQSYGR
jgi:hypothetical protein